MTQTTVRQLVDTLAALPEQDAVLVVWTSDGEVARA